MDVTKLPSRQSNYADLSGALFKADVYADNTVALGREHVSRASTLTRNISSRASLVVVTFVFFLRLLL